MKKHNGRLNKLTRNLWLLLFGAFFHTQAQAVIQFTWGPAPYSYITARGTAPYTGWDDYTGYTGARFIQMDYIVDQIGGQTYHGIYTGQCTANNLSSFVNQVNSILASGIVLNWNMGGAGPTPAQISRLGIGYLQVVGWCDGHQFLKNFRSPGPDIEVNPPEPPEPPGSVCSLSNPNLTLNFQSNSLNVNGNANSTSLAVSCTGGTAQNYRLSLIGSGGNVTGDGQLAFGNGVTARISLDGTSVSAGGAGISLNGLTSRNISVRGVLSGTASAPGSTSTSGVLVFESQ